LDIAVTVCSSFANSVALCCQRCCEDCRVPYVRKSACCTVYVYPSYPVVDGKIYVNLGFQDPWNSAVHGHSGYAHGSTPATADSHKPSAYRDDRTSSFAQAITTKRIAYCGWQISVVRKKIHTYWPRQHVTNTGKRSSQRQSCREVRPPNVFDALLSLKPSSYLDLMKKRAN